MMPSAEQPLAKAEKTFDKEKLIAELGEMIVEVNLVKARDPHGEIKEQIARAGGHVDGYMRALIDTGVCTVEELKELVKLQREKAAEKSRSESYTFPL